MRYLALETLTRLALLPDVNEAVVAHQPAITASLRVRGRPQGPKCCDWGA